VRPKRVGVVLPDSVARVSLVRFDSVPARAADLEQLVHWQMRKAAPFRLEDAQVNYVPGAKVGDGGREFVVTLARRDVIEEYEGVCADVGARAGLVDLATFSLINIVLASSRTPPSGDWLLVHWTPDYSTLAVIRGADLIFFRSRLHEGEADLADLVHQRRCTTRTASAAGAFRASSLRAWRLRVQSMRGMSGAACKNVWGCRRVDRPATGGSPARSHHRQSRPARPAGVAAWTAAETRAA